ncbi:hypothetical protein KY290_021132 [Solanum tuberosum]|uniref:Protein kinase domain-containing protein n=1 Tax=Solanum tuberosum TaxID=4113 RepID=A0ABQ7V0Q2_SOLTU|nr:hypothetical protein KY289_020303 [Solanum tuberosum]KAH0692966.1 hypothetical protein KY285_020063 [Solanum tuberosum]KAH0757639.1 hypothetical protein KY290_021132 [Solanum tuberosum]
MLLAISFMMVVFGSTLHTWLLVDKPSTNVGEDEGKPVFELITGTPLWEDADVDDVLNKIEFEEPKFQNSKLSNEAQYFLEKCLVKNPIMRWTADMLLNHTFLQNSSKVVHTRKKKSDSMSILHKPIQKITFKIGNHKFSSQLPDPKPLLHKTI